MKRDLELESWRGILGNPNARPVRCHSARAMVLGDVAMVFCYEEIEGLTLVATNAFRREGRAWKLIHHQAGRCEVPPPEAEVEQIPLQ